MWLHTSSAIAQDLGDRNTIIVEGLGNSLMGFTINYEKTLLLGDFGMGLRAGAGYVPWEFEYTPDETIEYLIPVTVSLRRWGVELGVGVTFTGVDKNEIVPAGVLAYRYVYDHYMIRLSVAPAYVQDYFQSETCGYRDYCPPRRIFPIPGLSLGYSF